MTGGINTSKEDKILLRKHSVLPDAEKYHSGHQTCGILVLSLKRPFF